MPFLSAQNGAPHLITGLRDECENICKTEHVKITHLVI